MTLRRYSPMKKSRGTTWPPEVRLEVARRDRWHCIGPTAGMSGDCGMGLELDHVRASHGTGMKSRSTADNGALLCGPHHRYKTDHGKEVRPLLLAYIASKERAQ